MTVPAQTPYNRYTANGATTVFAYTFRVENEEDLGVFINDVATTTGFTVSGLGDNSGGSVTFTIPPNDQDEVFLVRDMPYNRENDYQKSGDFRADTVNDDFDRLWLAIQQINGNTQGSFLFRQNPVDPTFNILPTPQQGYGLTWGTGGEIVNKLVENTVIIGNGEATDATAGINFNTLSDLVNGTASGGRNVDFEDIIGDANSDKIVKVAVRINNTSSKSGGAFYDLKTLVQHRVDISDPAWVPNGAGAPFYYGVDHYVGGGTDYVVILNKTTSGAYWADSLGCRYDSSISDYTPLQLGFSQRVCIEFTDKANYYLDQFVDISNSGFAGRVWWCQGQATLRNMTGYSGIQLKVRGGSGDLNRGLTARGLRHVGDSVTGIAVEFNGCNGFRYYEPYFESFDVAVQMHNENANEFTEGCIVIGARMKNCNHDLVLKRTNGNDSFHGSGLFQCWLNPIAGQSPIVVGDGCLWYNGVLDINSFSPGLGTPLIDMEASESPQQSVVGALRLEGQINPIVGGTGSDSLNLVGGVTTLNETHYGRLQLARAIINTGPEAANATIVHRSAFTSTTITGVANEVVTLGRDGKYLVVGSDTRFEVETSNNTGSMPHISVINVISGIVPPPSRFTNSGDDLQYIEPNAATAVQVHCEPTFNPAGTSQGKTLEYYTDLTP